MPHEIIIKQFTPDEYVLIFFVYDKSIANYIIPIFLKQFNLVVTSINKGTGNVHTALPKYYKFHKIVYITLLELFVLNTLSIIIYD